MKVGTKLSKVDITFDPGVGGYKLFLDGKFVNVIIGVISAIMWRIGVSSVNNFGAVYLAKVQFLQKLRAAHIDDVDDMHMYIVRQVEAILVKLK